MGTTANGLPWPVGTDLVKDGDNAMKALADATEIKLAPVNFSGSSIQSPGTIVASKASRIFSFSGSATTNQYGQIAITISPAMSVIHTAFMDIQGASTAMAGLQAQVDMTNRPTNGGTILFLVYKPTGVLHTNTYVQYVGLIVGQ